MNDIGPSHNKWNKSWLSCLVIYINRDRPFMILWKRYLNPLQISQLSYTESVFIQHHDKTAVPADLAMLHDCFYLIRSKHHLTPVLVIATVTGADPLKDVPDSPVPIVNGLVVLATTVAELPKLIGLPLIVIALFTN